MSDYQIALIYDEYHDQKAINLMNRLNTAGINVLRCTQYTPTAEMERFIKKSDFVFALLVDDAPLPFSLVQATEYIVQNIRDRDKQLYVIKETRASLPPDFQGYPILEPEDGTLCSPHGGRVAGMICDLVVNAQNKQMLYEKLAAMIAIDYDPGIQETLSALCEMLCAELLEPASWKEPPQENIAALLRILEEMNRHPTGYGQKEKENARKMLAGISKVTALTEHFLDLNDLFCLACALRIIELYQLIRASCVDTTTTGDVDLYSNPLPESYQTLSARFLPAISVLNDENDLGLRYSPEQIRLILEQEARCKANGDSMAKPAPTAKREKEEKETHLTETETKLHDIAEFMSKGYALFESISQDRTAVDFLRCLKTSFERLKNYCNIIDAKAISAQCISYIAQIDQKLSRMDITEPTEDKAELGLKALLGLKLPHSGQYDVFISYKHEDEDIARSVYRNIQSKMLTAFFDKVTLPELSESDYDEAIMTALDHAQHFLVIITNMEQLRSYWIRLEMKTFHHEMVEGRKENANFIMLVTDSVYKQIMDSNKTVLPLRYRSCEILKISNYKESLYGYLSK